jgi:DHA3 family tetracycline resistance protein-like MFS transporter
LALTSTNQIKAYRVFLTYNFLKEVAYSLVFTFSSVYLVTVAGLDPLQLVLVGTSLEVSIFLFEIPTGVVADTFSRRWSVIIGVFMIGVSFAIMGMLPFFIPVLLSQVLWGVGFTFTSGALQAWITDEIGEEHAAPAFVRGMQVGSLGALVGTLIAAGLGNIALHIPILSGAGMFIVLGFYLLLKMSEHGFHPTPVQDRTTFQRMWGTLRSGARMVKIRPALISILLIGFFLGLYSEGYDRMWVAHILERFTLPDLGALRSVTWFAIIRTASMLLNAVAGELVQRRVDLNNTKRLVGLMAVSSFGVVICLVGFALGHWFGLTVALVLVISVLRNLIDPLYTAWVNHRLDSSVRATVISMSSQVDAIGQIAGGPFVGLIARQASIQSGLLTSAGLLAPILVLFGLQLAGKGEDEGRQSVTKSDINL